MARRLTQQQRRRIRQKQQKHLEEHLDNLTSPKQEGQVITNFGKSLIVETAEGKLIRCKPRQNLGNIVCGDQVLIQAIDDEESAVIAVQSRESFLQKPGFGGKLKAMAANVDQVVIVTATQPLPNPYLIDRYLVASENLPAKALIIINKIDLLSEEDRPDIDDIERLYHQLGYRVLKTSKHDPNSMAELRHQLESHTSIFVGLSGVGKSSLINALLPDHDIRIGDISAATGEGTHTTTNSTLYHLHDGGDLIDSPGVRDFGLWNTSADDILNGFIEFRPFAGHCKFSDCKHDNEPGCAILEALEEHKITEQRYQHYQKMIAEYTT